MDKSPATLHLGEMTALKKKKAKEEALAIKAEIAALNGQPVYLAHFNKFLRKGREDIVRVYLKNLRLMLAAIRRQKKSRKTK